MMAYNPYISPYSSAYLSNAWANSMQQTPDQIYQNYQQMLQNNPFNPQSQPNPAMNNRGDYIRIKEYKEVETYPCRADGVATLFFDFETMSFYSKKILNGKAVIQSFVFSPMNMTGTDIPPQEDSKPVEPSEVETKPDALNMILDKMEQMERTIKNQGRTISTLKKNAQQATSAKQQVTDNSGGVKDEL